MRKFFIYKIVNKINNKIYIGKSCDPKMRWARHVYDSKKTRQGSKQLVFHKAISKYRAENFIIEIISEHDNNELALLSEKEWIKYYKSNDLSIGYNMTEGGEGFAGYKRTDEEKEAISIRNSGANNGMFGKPVSKEKREKLSFSVKIAKSKKNNSNKPFSSEVIEKLKQAVLEKNSQKLSDSEKDEIVILYNGGKFIKRDLAKIFGVEEKTIKYIIRYWREVKGNKSKHLTSEQKQQIIDLYNTKEYTKKEISEITKIAFNRVEAAIKMYRNKLTA